MLGYEFVDLSTPQLEQRRIQLDEAGFHAWLSPLVLLISLYSYRLVVKQSHRLSKQPRHPSRLTKFVRRVSWIINTTYIPEFGPLQVQLVGVAYLTWLIYLAVRGTGKDYMHVTKAFGHVAVSQLPMQYLLSLKSALSPITIATGLTHERLNAYHRLHGRIIHALLAVHAVLYVNFFLAKGLLSKRVRDRDVQFGLTAFWLFNILGPLAIPPVRRKLYFRVFYRSHIVITAIVPVVLFFHVPYTRVYVVQAGVFWLAGGVLRKSVSETVSLKCESVPHTDLQRVTLKTNAKSHFKDWIPGQHIYVHRGGLGPRNPFTIAKVEDARNGFNIELVVRHLHGPATDYFQQLATRQRGALIEIEGPYGEASMYMPNLIAQGTHSGHAVVVAGGVGATYALPVYLALLDARSSFTGLKLIWFVRSLADAEWGLDYLNKQSQKVNVEVHITQAGTKDMSKVTETEEKRSLDGVVIHNHGRRPNMSQVVKSSFDVVDSTRIGQDIPRSHGDDSERIIFLICGPPSLSQSLRKEVGQQVFEHGRNVYWYEEQFGFGGS